MSEEPATLKIAFRADANALVGVGHLMRCLSIADAVREFGMASVFIMADGAMGDFVQSRGHKLRVLGSEYDDMAGELPALREVLDDERPTLQVIDSYHATPEYFLGLRYFSKVAWVDDFMAEAMPVDAVVNCQIYADAKEYGALYRASEWELPRLLLGPSMMPLRSGFAAVRKRSPCQEVRDVLIAVGGSDPERMAKRLADALAMRSELTEGRSFHFMLGNLEPDLAELCKRATCCSWLKVHKGVTNVAALMDRMDVAISAAGTTLYELCARGVPTVAYCLSEDQVRPVHAFEQNGAVLFGGDFRCGRPSFEALFGQLRALCDNPFMRSRLSSNACRLVDGRGAVRLANALRRTVEPQEIRNTEG